MIKWQDTNDLSPSETTDCGAPMDTDDIVPTGGNLSASNDEKVCLVFGIIARLHANHGSKCLKKLVNLKGTFSIRNLVQG